MAVLFKIALEREIGKIMDRHGLPASKAFNIWFATSMLEIEESEAVEAASVEGANDKGIDLFYVDDEEERVLIVQGKYSKDLRYAAKESDLSTLQGSIQWLANPKALEREGRPELVQASRDFLEARKNGYGIELIYAYAGPKAANVDKAVVVYNQNPENNQQNRACRHFHADLLGVLWQEIESGRQRIQDGELEIANGYIENEGNFGKALVATVPCAELVKLYEKHEDKLFDRNVRLFLGARKGTVNAGIAATIQSEDQRGNFWAYNNGITIICDAYEVHESRIVKLSNFSIVNGCQTTVSLAANNGQFDDLFVLVRCIAATATIVDDVIRFTNSQNPIRTWDIASQDKTQKRLKRELEGLKKPYYYLTRRGDRPSGSNGKFKDNGKTRQIKIELLGQYLAAFHGDPVLAYKHKAFIFSRNRAEVFPPDITVEEALFCWTAGEICKEVVEQMMRDDQDDARILKKGGKFFTVAVLSEVAKLHNGVTYLTKMPEERITGANARARLVKYARYAAKLYLSAARDQAENETDELATLIRQREFYEKVLGRARRQYGIHALNTDWLKGVLPNLR